MCFILLIIMESIVQNLSWCHPTIEYLYSIICTTLEQTNFKTNMGTLDS